MSEIVGWSWLGRWGCDIGGLVLQGSFHLFCKALALDSISLVALGGITGLAALSDARAVVDAESVEHACGRYSE